jgi:hypothetical protein
LTFWTLKLTLALQLIQESLTVNPEIATTQSEGDLESSFTPGSSFGFNVILQLEKEADSDDAIDVEASDSKDAPDVEHSDSEEVTEDEPAST